MAELIEKNVDPELYNLLFVKGEDGAYKGWRKELLVEEITDKLAAKFLLCNICKGVLRDACLFEKDDKHEVRCSHCILKETHQQIAHINRETVNEKQVCCPLKSKGCDWANELSELLRHLEECGLFTVQCPLGCINERGEVSRMERREVENHRTCCPMRNIRCEYCWNNVKSCEINQHLEVCGEFPIQCVNECEQNLRVKRKEISNHLSKECPLQVIRCPYSQYGCEVRAERRNLDRHEKENIHLHLKLTLNKMEKIEEENKYLRKKDNKFNYLLIPIINSVSNGKFEWKILEVKERISSKGNMHILYSDPFYVGLYKFQGSIEFHTTDNYIGLYLHIMKGEWDDMLQWPLKHKYSMVLMNKLKAKDNYKIKYENPQNQRYSHCLERPSTERNVGLGKLRFCSHADLLHVKYSKDNSITVIFSVELIVSP